MSFSGTRSFAAAAFASSTVTPRACPDAGSRVAQKVDAAGPTAMATRSDPVGAMSRAAASSPAAKTALPKPISRAMPAAIFMSDDVLSKHMATCCPPVSVIGASRRVGWAKARCSRAVPADRNNVGTLRFAHPCYGLRTAHARHRGKVAVGIAAIVVFDADIVAQGVDETRLPVARIIFRVMNGDHVLKLRWAYLADTLERAQFVGVRRTGGIREGLLVETGGFDDQGVTFEMPDRVAVVEWPSLQLVIARHRLVHGDR